MYCDVCLGLKAMMAAKSFPEEMACRLPHKERQGNTAMSMPEAVANTNYCLRNLTIACSSIRTWDLHVVNWSFLLSQVFTSQ